MKICPRCGIENEQSNVFCHNCHENLAQLSHVKIEAEPTSARMGDEVDLVAYEYAEDLQMAGSVLTKYLGALAHVKLPYGITKIGNQAFMSNHHVQSVQLSSSVLSIGESAFEDCVALQSISLNKVAHIAEDAFEGCKALSQVKIPTSVQQIGKKAFEGCDALTIFAEADSKPLGWHKKWNGDCKVVWSVALQEMP